MTLVGNMFSLQVVFPLLAYLFTYASEMHVAEEVCEIEAEQENCAGEEGGESEDSTASQSDSD